MYSSSYRNGQPKEQVPNSVLYRDGKVPKIGTQGIDLPQGRGTGVPELEIGKEDEVHQSPAP